MARTIILRTFPTEQGDVQTVASESELIKSLDKDSTVVMDGKAYTDWDELLQDIQSKPEASTIEVFQYKPIVGG